MSAAQLLSIFQPSASQLERLQMSARLRTARSITEVLIADGNANTRTTLHDAIYKNVLLNHSKVYTAASAKEAWSQYFSYAPDICFFNVAMPEIDGYRLTRLVNVIDPTASIVLIAEDQSQIDGKRFKECGAKGFITQPIELQKLQALVHKLQPVRKPANKKR